MSPTATARRARFLPPGLAALLLACCGGGGDGLAVAGDAPAVATLDPATAPPAEVVRAVLENCHGSLIGMDRVVVEVAAADGAAYTVFAQLPDRLRVQTADGVAWLQSGDTTAAMRGTRAGELSAHEAELLHGIRVLVDAAALGPLHRAVRSERLGPRSFRLFDAAGASHDCELEAGALRVATLRCGDDAVAVLEHLDTGASHVVRRASVAALGDCTLRFVKSDFTFAPSMFEVAVPEPQGTRIAAPPLRTVGGEARPTEPALTEQAAHRIVVLDDPGDWPARTRLAQEHAQVLEGQGQRLFGFVAFFEEDGRPRMGIPFRARGDATFTPPPQWEVRDRPAGRVLLVFPPNGDVAGKTAAGRAALERALAQQHLRADGPILAQPYLHLDEGEPPPEKLAAPVVRVTVRVE